MTGGGAGELGESWVSWEKRVTKRLVLLTICTVLRGLCSGVVDFDVDNAVSRDLVCLPPRARLRFQALAGLSLPCSTAGVS